MRIDAFGLADAFQELHIPVDIPDSFGALPPRGKIVARECQKRDVKQSWTSIHLVASNVICSLHGPERATYSSKEYCSCTTPCF